MPPSAVALASPPPSSWAEPTLLPTLLLPALLPDGCSDLKLRIRTPILTSTLEVFNSASLTVYVGSPGQQQHQVASTVLLDPPLAGVALVVPLALPSPTFILSSAIPPSAKTTRAEAWVGTTLRATASAGEGAADEDDVVLRVPTPPEDGPEQWTFKLGQEADGRWGWGVGGLQREEAGGEGDGYPILR